jgi:hypothetical protein
LTPSKSGSEGAANVFQLLQKKRSENVVEGLLDLLNGMGMQLEKLVKIQEKME